MLSDQKIVATSKDDMKLTSERVADDQRDQGISETAQPGTHTIESQKAT